MMSVQQEVVDAIGSHALSIPLQISKAIVRALVQVCASACFAERWICLLRCRNSKERDGF